MSGAGAAPAAGPAPASPAALRVAQPALLFGNVRTGSVLATPLGAWLAETLGWRLAAIALSAWVGRAIQREVVHA